MSFACGKSVSHSWPNLKNTPFLLGWWEKPPSFGGIPAALRCFCMHVRYVEGYFCRLLTLPVPFVDFGRRGGGVSMVL